jgi:hypothetical protein
MMKPQPNDFGYLKLDFLQRQLKLQLNTIVFSFLIYV